MAVLEQKSKRLEWKAHDNKFMIYINVVQLQARGPHVTRHSVFSGQRKHSGKIVKSEIC